MCTFFANLYVLSTCGPHMVHMGSPYIFYIYMIKMVDWEKESSKNILLLKLNKLCNMLRCSTCCSTAPDFSGNFTIALGFSH